MSMLSNFKNDLPLTPKKLVSWLSTIIEKIDNCVVDYSVLDTLVSKNQGTNITSIVSVSAFNAMHDAIANAKSIEAVNDGNRLSLLSAWIDDVPDDDFYAIGLTFLNSQSKYVKLVITKMQNAIYLDTKTVIAITG